MFSVSCDILNKLYKQFSHDCMGEAGRTVHYSLTRLWVAAIITFPPNVPIYWVTAASPLFATPTYTWKERDWRQRLLCFWSTSAVLLGASNTDRWMHTVALSASLARAPEGQNYHQHYYRLYKKIIIIAENYEPPSPLHSCPNSEDETSFAVWLLFIDSVTQELKNSLEASVIIYSRSLPLLLACS